MKISWITKCNNWAFFNLCKHLQDKLPNHEHTFNDEKNCDIKVICSPNFITKNGCGNGTILRLDSLRALEKMASDN